MKRLLASLLCLSLFFGSLTLGAISAAPEVQKHYAGVGDYTVSLQADPVTNIIPSDFGTTAANGKVWTDKSVKVTNDRFNVTLSALAQEYISENNTTVTSGVAADVVMILDLSASMQKNTLKLDNVTMTRTKAMVKAVNEALEIIMQANNDNLVLIYTYQSNSSGSTPVTNELLPLGHYTNTAWKENDVFSGNSGKYFNYIAGNSSDTIKSASDLKKDGSSFSQKSLSTAYGTCTQHGILKGVQTLATAIGKESKSVDRKPYVLLFTDGAPGNATKSWYDSASTSCNFSHSNSSTAEISALSVLTAAYMKNTLDTAYTTYNGKSVGIEWFNIGLGVGSSELGTLFLQPHTIATGTSTSAINMRTNITTYTSGQYSAYSSYANSYAYTLDSYLVDSGDDLQGAFTQLAGRIEEETKSITSPIISVEGASSDLTFTDTLGVGMSLNNVYLHTDDNTSVFGILNGNTYSFNGYDMTAVITTDSLDRCVLTWNIPGDEVPIFAFADRANPTDGSYVAADPIRLTYDVQVTNPDSYKGETLYSNALATAEFNIPSDNTYYYEKSGAMKAAPLAAKVKNQNITGLSEYSATYATQSIENGACITATLGNNGRLSPTTTLIKSAENSSVQAGTEITFHLSVTNKGQTDLSGVIITDNLPDGLAYKAGSAQNATVAEDGSVLTFTIPFITVGQTVTVNYNVVVDPDAATGESFTNTAAISRINEIDVYGPAETSSTITSYRTYRVIYQWTGDIPPGQVIPTDNNRYGAGAYYGVDTVFTSQTKIENKDRFGNVTQRWSFSGWTDPNLGQMGEADVTVRGVWSYEAFAYPAHRVIYTWSGDIPPGRLLPTDEGSYVKNQPYTIDNTFTAATEIKTKDAYGNINGKYTFSGWADPNSGIMGDEDVIIPGVWTYETINVSAHKVIYSWTGDIPAGQFIPTDGTSYAPNQNYPVDTTFTADTQLFSYDVYGNVNGKYTFSGWTDPNSGVMGNQDVTVRGVWSYETLPVPSHRVIYTWSGTIPQGETLPTDDSRYVNGQAYSVDGTYTAATVIPTYDAYGNMNGRYTFSGWADPNSGVMGEADVTIPGVWTYEALAVPSHRVIYTWSGDIPDGQVVPQDGNSYVKNQTYNVDAVFTSQTKFFTYDAYGNVKGRYTFSGWTEPNSGIMGEADVTIVGVWRYETVPVPDHRVFYLWFGEIPPNEVLPTDENTYVNNQAYLVDDTYTADTEIPAYDAHGNVKGTYTFSGWTDPNSGTMGDADVTVSGIWKYEAVDIPTHRVYYVWSGEIPPEAVLPTDENTYVKNQTYLVDNTYTAQTGVLSYDTFGNINGKYTFSGWTDPNSGIMGESDVVIPGVWEFTAIEPPPVVTPENSQPEPPKTGDRLSVKQILILWALCAVGVTLSTVLRRKGNNNRKKAV